MFDYSNESNISGEWDRSEPLGVAMDALRKVVPVSQILYGTDYWYRTAAETAKGLTTNRVFNDAELRAINRGNIETILPRYKS